MAITASHVFIVLMSAGPMSMTVSSCVPTWARTLHLKASARPQTIGIAQDRLSKLRLRAVGREHPERLHRQSSERALGRIRAHRRRSRLRIDDGAGDGHAMVQVVRE